MNHLRVGIAAEPISLAQPRCALLTFFTFPVGVEGQAWLSEHLQGKAVVCKMARSGDTCTSVSSVLLTALVLLAWRTISVLVAWPG